MTTTSILTLSLEDFLNKPNIDESPAWEYINGKMLQKPMPQTHHSRLQLKLATAIELVAESNQIALAFPELRCTFGGRSIVPDIAVILWDKIPFNEAGESENSSFFSAPDWTIEILSPKQNSTKVIDNILHCLEYGSQLGWLIDPDERSILVFQPQQTPKIYKSNLSENETAQQTLPILDTIDLRITAEQFFGWLKMNP
ncbi:Uma2 family endonuclease [Crocosphaera sp. UHCC 0190]|uniref:Uma2 family endonuclease n=1 Tax=Crocosphaera sp. UHCC 0190 TaxID=3110246 RepID=UPI002B2060F1|nr:Uma2 family endonuclease [Crocosphaera sp. UHCC 0190]MEA5511365.1 Uma2 family endonuclease [Crocosphaera sp. UHCC 0190]